MTLAKELAIHSLTEIGSSVGYHTMGRPIPWSSTTRSTYWRGLVVPWRGLWRMHTGPRGAPRAGGAIAQGRIVHIPHR